MGDDVKQDGNITISRERYDALLDENLSFNGRIALLEAALKPFADEARAIEREFGPAPEHTLVATLKYGDLRYALESLERDDS